MILTTTILVITLVLGLSLVGSGPDGQRIGLRELWRYFLIAVGGLGVAGLLTILGVILLWPPHDPLATGALLGFLGLLAGTYLFIRYTLTGRDREEAFD